VQQKKEKEGKTKWAGSPLGEPGQGGKKKNEKGNQRGFFTEVWAAGSVF